MSTNTWLQNSLQKLLHTNDRKSWHVQLATTLRREQQSSRKQIFTCAAFSLPVLPHFHEVVGLGWYVLSMMEQLNWDWHWNLFCSSKPSKQAILEGMNGRVLKYFQYLVAGSTNKWHFVNTDKKNNRNIICKKIPFPGEEHLASPSEYLRESLWQSWDRNTQLLSVNLVSFPTAPYILVTFLSYLSGDIVQTQ